MVPWRYYGNIYFVPCSVFLVNELTHCIQILTPMLPTAGATRLNQNYAFKKHNRKKLEISVHAK